jgi:hypothetical protein
MSEETPSIVCVGFPGFQNPENRYRVATISDYDECPFPNGTLVVEWKPEDCCEATVISSIDASQPPHPSGYYAGIEPGTKLPASWSQPIDKVLSDTFSGGKGCSAEGDESIKVSITLSSLITD